MDDEHWIATLPFCKDRQTRVLGRAKSMGVSLKRNAMQQQNFQDLMQKIFDNGHAEPLAPALPTTLQAIQ